MKRVLLTGMSGTGKSSVIGELAALGYKAVDTDGGWCEPLPGGRQRWREDAIAGLLDTQDADVLFIAGCEENQASRQAALTHPGHARAEHVPASASARFLYLAAHAGAWRGQHGRPAAGDRRFAVVNTADPGGGAGNERARPAEDAAEYVRRMRSLPAGQLIGDLVFSLLDAAQVKLGRRDARLLIDLATVAHEHARGYLPGELTKQIDQMLGQLRLAQVSAEGHPDPGGEPEENDLDRVPAPPSAAAQ